MNNIKKLRKEKKLSQLDLAKILNVHQTAISQWETNKTNPDMAQAVQLADFFNTSVDHILGRTDYISDKILLENPKGGKMSSREKKQLGDILENAQALFFDEEVSENDKEKFIRDITDIFWEAKAMNKRSK